jgi:hypothetical protein
VKEEGERRRPRMGKRQSRSSGDVLRERPGFKYIYPAPGGRGIRTCNCTHPLIDILAMSGNAPLLLITIPRPLVLVDKYFRGFCSLHTTPSSERPTSTIAFACMKINLIPNSMLHPLHFEFQAQHHSHPSRCRAPFLRVRDRVSDL